MKISSFKNHKSFELISNKKNIGFVSSYKKFNIPAEVDVEGYGIFKYAYSEMKPLTGKAFFYTKQTPYGQHDITITFW